MSNFYQEAPAWLKWLKTRQFASKGSITTSGSMFIFVSKEVHALKCSMCYANAVATMILAAEARLRGSADIRHCELVSNVINIYGLNGSHSLKALKEFCGYKELPLKVNVDQGHAAKALRDKRLILGTFNMNSHQWYNMFKFFQATRAGVLTKAVVNEGVKRDVKQE